MAVFRMAGRAAALAVVRLTMRFAVGFADDFATGLAVERLLTLTVRLAAGLAMERVVALAVVRFAAGFAMDLLMDLAVMRLVVRFAAGLAAGFMVRVVLAVRFAAGLAVERLLTLTVRLAAGLAMERVVALAVVRLAAGFAADFMVRLVLAVRFAAGFAADFMVRLAAGLAVLLIGLAAGRVLADLRAAGLALLTDRVLLTEAVVRLAAGLVAALADALAAGLAGCILVSFSICLPISLRVRLLSVFLACGMSFDSSNLRCWRRFSISTWTLALKRASCGRILDSSPSMRLAICCCSTACRTISRPRRLSFACIGG